MTISPHDVRLTGVSWRKSRHSNSQGTCVELARLAGGEVAVRNSRFPGGPVHVYSRAEMRALIEGVKEGGFDHLLRGPVQNLGQAHVVSLHAGSGQSGRNW